jgi:hypothetical protein
VVVVAVDVDANEEEKLKRIRRVLAGRVGRIHTIRTRLLVLADPLRTIQ